MHYDEKKLEERISKKIFILKIQYQKHAHVLFKKKRYASHSSVGYDVICSAMLDLPGYLLGVVGAQKQIGVPILRIINIPSCIGGKSGVQRNWLVGQIYLYISYTLEAEEMGAG